MRATEGVILCSVYILGLLLTVLLPTAVPWTYYLILALSIGAVGVGAAVVVPRFWRAGPKSKVWSIAASIGFLAPLYFYLMIPRPAVNDISQFILPANGKAIEQVVTVRGKVISAPRLTRSKRAQFWLKATQLDEVRGREAPVKVGQSVAGKLYVTVPLLQATGLNLGDSIAVTGSLYKPKTASNPGGFDFQAYLAREGTFAGLRGKSIAFPKAEISSKWGWWAIGQRIVRSQTRWLGIPEGPFVSVMVLGSQSVSLYLSTDIKDRFTQTGLSHALSASGFQVSMILGIVLALTRRLSLRAQFGCGLLALLLFVGLAGLQPPVMRAALMGIAALIGLVLQRKVNPIGSLLFAATILLLINPLWITNLSFQLSFLATLGLLVTVPPLIKRLDWMPPLFASLAAIPIAASIWTLPLQLYNFNVVSPYSILVNILSTPLISIISIGGFISAIAASIWPLAGSALAWPLYYPSQWLIGLVQFFCQLPGNSVAVGSVSILQLIVLYGLIGLVWLQGWWQRRWWLAGLIAVSLVVVPVWYVKTNLFQVTVLATSGDPVLAIQDKGKVTLTNGWDDNTLRYTTIPFLRQQGVNRIDWAIATNLPQGTSNSRLTLPESLPIETFYATNASTTDSKNQPTSQLAVGQTVQIGSTVIKLVNLEPPALQFQIQGQSWLLLGDVKPQESLVNWKELPNAEVLVWSGKRLAADWLEAVRPKVAIASNAAVDPDTAAQLRKNKTELYLTNRDGAVQWTPGSGFETTLELAENNASLL